MKIGVIVPSVSPNARYRAIRPAQELAERGHNVLVAAVPYGDLPSFDQFEGMDIVLIWQAYQRLTQFVKRLRAAGIASVWDSDDDITALPRGTTSYATVGGARGQRVWGEMKVMLRAVDMVTTPSAKLASLFRSAGQDRVSVIENYVWDVRDTSSASRKRIVVGWVGAAEHQLDVGPLRLRDQLMRVLDARSQVEVATVGVVIDLPGPRYTRTNWVDLSELASHIARFDIGISPIVDSQFNRARSNVKLKEYAAAGVPWLASNVGPYVGMGEEQGGRLVDNDRWHEAIIDLVDDRKARKRLGARALKWARTQTVDQHVHEWERVFELAIERAAARRQTPLRA